MGSCWSIDLELSQNSRKDQSLASTDVQEILYDEYHGVAYQMIDAFYRFLLIQT